MKRNSVIYTCIVPNCTSTYKLNSKDRHFFRLPKNEPYRSQWIEELSLLVPHNSVRVCDLHFETKFFTSTLRQRLIKYAIPTILQPDPNQPLEYADDNDLKSSEDMETMTNNELVLQLIDSNDNFFQGDTNEAVEQEQGDNVEYIEDRLSEPDIPQEIEINQVHEHNNIAFDMDIGESIVIITESDEESQDPLVEDNNPVIINNHRESHYIENENVINISQKRRKHFKNIKSVVRWQKNHMLKMSKEINVLKYTVGRLRKKLRKMKMLVKRRNNK